MNIQSKMARVTKSKFKTHLLPYCLIALFTFMIFAPNTNAESLFTLGASQNYHSILILK